MYRIRDGGNDRPILFKRARFIVVVLIILLSLMLFSTNLPASSASQKATKNVDTQVALLAILDPTVNLPSVADAQTSQKHPDTNYGTNPLMYSGNMLDGLSYRSYLRFDLSPIPTGAIINSATLTVYVASATGSPTIDVLSVVQGWTESTITWNNQPIPSPLIIDSQVISSSPGFVSWDITSLVSMWFGGKVLNSGICLKGPTSAESYAQFHTREGSNSAYIQVSYEVTYPPGVTTTDASSITTTSAALNGNLDSTGGLACQVWFEYGETESYGSSTTSVPKISTGPFSAVTPGLTPDTTYHFRACASNSEGTVCGSDMTFKTGKETYPPQVSISYSPESPDTNEEVTFTAEASDDSGIKKIQIFVSGDKAHECSESPCIYVGGPYPEGMVNYSAKVWDTEDNMAVTEDRSFSVEPALTESECPRWDINEDCIVDYLDLVVLSHHYDEASQSPYPRWDINEDGTAELRDLSLLAAHFMEIACECTDDMKKEIEKIPSVLHPQLQNLPWR